MKGTYCTSKPSSYGWYSFIPLILFISCLTGQGYEVSGRAFNDAGKKIGPVRVVIYDQDKRKVTELETGGNGKFKFKNIPDGKYTMNIYGPDGYGIPENFSVSGAKISDLKPALNPSPDQVQIKMEPAGNGASLNWQSVPQAAEYIIYRDNNEIGTVKETFFLDEVAPGQTFAYNVVTVKNDQTMGTRSITEYGKALMSPPENLVAEAKKNTIKLVWDEVVDATGYKIYRDDKEVNSTPDNSYTDFKLKFSRVILFVHFSLG